MTLVFDKDSQRIINSYYNIENCKHTNGTIVQYNNIWFEIKNERYNKVRRVNVSIQGGQNEEEWKLNFNILSHTNKMKIINMLLNEE